MYNVLDALAKSDCSFDLDITVPLSKSSEFSEKFPRWSSKKKSNVTVFYPNTIGASGAKRILSKLPEYAKISKVRAFLNIGGPDSISFYSGPFELSTINKRVGLMESQIAEYARIVALLEKDVKNAASYLC